MYVEIVILEFTFVFAPIGECIGALSVFFAIFPGTNVFVLRRPRIGSQAVVPSAFVVTTWTLGRPPPLK